MLLDEWKPIQEEAAELSYRWHQRGDEEGVDPRFGKPDCDRYFDISREVGAEEAITRDHDHCQKIDQVNKQIRYALQPCKALWFGVLQLVSIAW